MATIIKSNEEVKDQILQLEGVVATESTLLTVKGDTADIITELQGVKLDTADIVTNTADIVTAVGTTNTKLDEIKAQLGGGASVSITTTVTAANTSTSLKASNTKRVSIYVRNNSNRDLWINYGAAAVVGQAILLGKQDAIFEDNYQGQVFAIWASGVTGSAEVIEVSTP
jgi:hypothetical protein